MAWERAWDAKVESYRVRRYRCTEKFGPSEIGVEARGCIYATVTESWLAGPSDLSERTISAVSVGLLRKPNLAMVPPDPTARGIWLDVFQDSVPRDQEPEAESLYRRQDFMLLARNATGEPEVREWRTLVVNDPKDGGLRPQQILGIRKLSYSFFERAPTELTEAIEAFVLEIGRAVEQSEAVLSGKEVDSR
jgi:hypothetical protein